MPTLITTKPLRYNSREMVADQEFVASERDARILVALGRATAKPSTPADPPAAEKTKRQYRRRDMVAEDGAERPSTFTEDPRVAAEEVGRSARISDF